MYKALLWLTSICVLLLTVFGLLIMACRYEKADAEARTALLIEAKESVQLELEETRLKVEKQRLITEQERELFFQSLR